MKKHIYQILLAGLLPLSLTACFSDDSALGQLPVTNENEEGWHGIVSAIVHNGNGPDFPISLLYWAYEASLCSSCREGIVKALMNRNHLPDQYREEMQWDANLDIRNMVGNK